MDAGTLWQVLRRELEAIRHLYVASGRGEEFDQYVATLRAGGRWPFDQ